MDVALGNHFLFENESGNIVLYGWHLRISSIHRFIIKHKQAACTYTFMLVPVFFLTGDRAVFFNIAAGAVFGFRLKGIKIGIAKRRRGGGK